MLRHYAKLILKHGKIEQDETSQKVIGLLNQLLSDPVKYKDNRPFIMRLVQYGYDKKRFTEVQQIALERIVSDG